MRASLDFLFLSVCWALLALVQILANGWGPAFLGPSIGLGVLIALIWTVPMLRSIEKNGEYKTPASAKRAVRDLAIIILLVGGLVAAMIYGLVPLFPPSLIGTLMLSLPIGYAIIAGAIFRWEVKRGQKIYSQWGLTTKYYSTPKSVERASP